MLPSSQSAASSASGAGEHADLVAAPSDAATLDVNRLYLEHQGWLRNWLRVRMDHSATAADLVHDTFVRVLSKPTTPTLSNPRGYLATIAGGLLKNHWRRQALEQAYEHALAHAAPAFEASPAHHYEIMETLLEISRLLDGLPQRVREIFLLSQLDDMTHPQIAEQLGISVNVVQKAMARAIRHCHRAVYA